jgi:hypothetical protein
VKRQIGHAAIIPQRPSATISNRNLGSRDRAVRFSDDAFRTALPPANPGTIAVVKGIQKMGIHVDRMAGGHGGVGNFADLARTVQ